MSDPYNYRPSAPPQQGRPQGWTGTSKMPMQALGAPPPDLQPSTGYGGPYQSQYGGQPPYGGSQPRPGGRPVAGGRPVTGGRPAARGGPGNFFKDRGKLADYTLKGLGLLGVALVAGFLWFLIRNDPATPNQANTNQQQQTGGQYTFTPYQQPSTVTNCAAHATDQVQAYLQQHPCTGMTRSLYTTSLSGDDKVVTSIAVVHMDNANAARGLKRVSDGNATGHVKDLVEDGVVIPNGPKGLQDAGYYSKVKGSDVVIIMTEYVDINMDSAANLNTNDTTLKAVSSDAAKQGIGVY